MSHVFISYVSEDSEKVQRLATELRARGAEVWLDRDSIAPGARWKDAIRGAIRSGAFFLACFSEKYAGRRTYMNTELAIAIEELSTRPTDTAWLLPVMLDPIDVPDRTIGGMESLRDIQWVRAYEDWDEAVRRLVAAIQPRIAAREMEARVRQTEMLPRAEPDPTRIESPGPVTESVVDRPPEWLATQTHQVRERALDERVLAVAFHPHRSLLATAVADNTARVWTLPRLERSVGPLSHDGIVNNVAFSPDGRLLATAGSDRAVRIWDVDTGDERLCLVHEDEVKSPYIFHAQLAFNESGSLLATAWLLGQLRVWDLSTGLPLEHIPGVKHINDLAFRPFEQLLVTGSGDGTARVWNIDTGDVVMSKPHQANVSNGVEQVAVSPDGALLATVAKDGSGRVWEVETGAEVERLRREAIRDLVFSQVGRLIAAACTDRKVRAWELDSGRELLCVQHPSDVRKVV
jgi:WD40 repeat protein